MLLRLRAPSGRLLDVLRPIPGVEILVPISPRAAVEVGYAHPIHLASASSCLPGDEMYLFRGRVGRVERIDGAPRFVDGRFLVRTEVNLREVDFEVENAVPNRTWNVRIKHDGRNTLRTQRATDFEGELDVIHNVRDRRGQDRIVVRAKSTTGEVCRVKLSI